LTESEESELERNGHGAKPLFRRSFKTPRRPRPRHRPSSPRHECLSWSRLRNVSWCG